jgi:hypothetical protein
MSAAQQAAQLQWRLSGGASNETATASIGGIMSTVAGGIILSQLATATTSTITGVTLGDASGNAIGSGTLTFTYSATAPTLQWTPYAGSIGTAVNVASNGTYMLQGGNDGGTLQVTVVAASLPGSNKTDTIAITAQDQKIFDDILKTESDTGKTYYRCIYLYNSGATATTDDKIDCEVYIAANTPGDDVISIGLATQAPDTGGATGVSGTNYPAAVADEFTAPAGVTFSQPTEDAPLTAFDLSSTSGSTYAKAIWIKREIPAGTYTSYTANSFRIGVKAKV